MADSERADKLAAARKKLQKFQQKGKGKKKSKKNSAANELITNDEPATQQITKGEEPMQIQEANHSVDSNRNAEENQSATNIQTHIQTAESQLSGSQTAEPTSSDVQTASQPRTDTQTLPLRTSSPSEQPSLSNGSGLPSASTESLHQLSQHINGLLSETSAFYSEESVENKADNAALQQLEARNRELAALLEKQVQANSQYESQLRFYQSQTNELQQEVEKTRSTYEDRQRRELAALKEQLQVHVQTIGILVAEKTELQSNLSQNQKQIDKKRDEVEELSARLSASRQRVADLERDFSSASSSSSKVEADRRELSRELDRLRLELYKITKAHDNLNEQNNELTSKLQHKVEECEQAEQRSRDLRHAVEMSELQIQQLSSNDQLGELSVLLERMKEEKLEYQKKVESSQETIESLVRERESLMSQYTMYAEQQTNQVQNLSRLLEDQNAAKLALEQESREKELEKQELAQKIDALSRQLQASNDVSETNELEQELTRSRDQSERLQSAVDELQHELDTRTQHAAQLAQELTEKETQLVELRNQQSQLGQLTVDQDQLLAEMNSDKAALSKAMEQNLTLKEQLAELQDAFIKMSNDNMELSSRLGDESMAAQMVGQKLGSHEEEISQLRQTLDEKERESSILQERVQKLSEQLLLEDRQQHAAAHGGIIQSLQQQLNEQFDTVRALTHENAELREELSRHTSRATSVANDTDYTSRATSVANDTDYTSIDPSSPVAASTPYRTATPPRPDGEVEGSTSAQYTQLYTAMQMLQDKFSAAMKDKAELLDENERLEHVLMQLQGETETIGQYVWLYREQRSQLVEKQVQNDAELAALQRQHDSLQNRLMQLTAQFSDLKQAVGCVVDVCDEPDVATTGTQPPEATENSEKEQSNMETEQSADSKILEPKKRLQQALAQLETLLTVLPATRPTVPHVPNGLSHKALAPLAHDLQLEQGDVFGAAPVVVKCKTCTGKMYIV